MCKFFKTSLERTSLSRDCEIIQIIAACSYQTFNRYVLSQKYRKQPVSLTKVAGCIIGIVQLRPHVFAMPLLPFSSGAKVAIGCTLDSTRLFKCAKQNGLDAEFPETIIGFVITLPMFRTLYKDSGW